MAYDNNRFCWHGVISTDTDKAQSFYSNVLGWTVQTMQMGDEESIMFAAGGVEESDF
jgi:predicted enzyme related to lactoylglutathione lyase